jgi:hypothetical protein
LTAHRRRRCNTTLAARWTKDGSLQKLSGRQGTIGVALPWFPELTSAVELARRQTCAADQADPVAQYFTALNEGDSRALETVWPGEVVIHDPRAGEIRGHKQLRRFVSQNQSWLAERHARIETVAFTCVGGGPWST